MQTERAFLVTAARANLQWFSAPQQKRFVAKRTLNIGHKSPGATAPMSKVMCPPFGSAAADLTRWR
jgi:hypothetical protein